MGDTEKAKEVRVAGKAGTDTMPGEIYTRPRYTRTEAARIVDISPGTFRNWAHGYTYRTTEGDRTSPGLITLAEAGHRLLVPFVGLAEAHVLNAFRRTGVSMQRIRPALTTLQREMGLRAALANRRLKTDGVEILYEYGQEAEAVGDAKVAQDLRELIVVRHGQRVFAEAVDDYLTTIVYEDDWVSAIHLRRYRGVDIIVDPRVNYGQPSMAQRGVRVGDIIARHRAGEGISDLAWDYELDEGDVRALLVAENLN